MVKQSLLFHKIVPKKILVIGDLMLDRYTFGTTSRISPEAPVPVIHVTHEEERLGGAANVALGLKALGMEVALVGRVGNDFAGDTLTTILSKNGIDTRFIFQEEHFQTTRKNRVIAGHQQVVRIDHEKNIPLSPQLEERVLQELIANCEQYDIVTISDYAKGFLSEKILETFLSHCHRRGLCVIVDPKAKCFKKYKHAWLIKPNISESYIAANMTYDMPLQKVAAKILEETQSEYVMITRSQDGISIFPKDSVEEHFPVLKIREVRDVVGAGDTVLAVLSAAIACKLPIEFSVGLANIAGSIAVEHIGCVQVTLQEIAKRLIEVHSESKIITEDHFPLIERAYNFEHEIFIEVHPEIRVSSELIKVLRGLYQKYQKKILIHVKDICPDEELVHLLASLREVEYVLMGTLSILSIDERIQRFSLTQNYQIVPYNK